MATNRPPARSRRTGVYYPESDGKPMAESDLHRDEMVRAIQTLQGAFAGHPDVYVSGNLLLYYEEGNPTARKAPDVMVVKGVDPSPKEGRRSFKSWEEKANPCFILELTSEGTAEEDTLHKRQLYERLGVREYFLFDPLNEYLERPLVGYRLIHGRYEPLIPAADGSVPSRPIPPVVYGESSGSTALPSSAFITGAPSLSATCSTSLPHPSAPCPTRIAVLLY